MRGKHGHDEDALQPVESLVRADANAAHLRQSPSQGPALTASFAAEAQRDAAALAMVGLSQVDELEVEREGSCKQDGSLDGKRVHQLERGCGVARGFLFAAASLGVTAANGALAQRFNVGKQIFAGLLAQHFAQQHA